LVRRSLSLSSLIPHGGTNAPSGDIGRKTCRHLRPTGVRSDQHCLARKPGNTKTGPIATACTDIGHAWQSLALAARSLGCESFALGNFSDDRVAEVCHLSGDEWPMLIVGLHGPSIPREGAVSKSDMTLFGGQPNRLTEEQVPYPLIEKVSRGHEAQYGKPSSPLLARRRHPAAAKSASRLMSPQARGFRRRRSHAAFRS